MDEIIIDHGDRIGVMLSNRNHMLATTHMNRTPYGSPQASVVVKLREGTNYANNAHAELRPMQQIHNRYRSVFLQPAVVELKRFHNAVLNNDRNLADSKAKWLEAPMSEPRLYTIANFLIGKSVNQIMELSLADSGIAAVALQFSKLLGVPDATIPGWKDTLMRQAIQRSFEAATTRSPTLADPLARRAPDGTAAALTKTTLEAYDTTERELNMAVSWMRDAIEHVSVMADMNVPAVWDAVQHQKAA